MSKKTRKTKTRRDRPPKGMTEYSILFAKPVAKFLGTSDHILVEVKKR